MHLHELRVRRRSRSRIWHRLWREWCFVVVVARKFRWRAILIAAILLLSGAAFYFIDAGQHTVGESLFYAWSLAFGEPPEAFPKRSLLLQSLYFVLPVLGLTVILEAIIEFALILRDRQRFERSWCMTMASQISNHIVLVGFGRLGFITFQLLRKLGEPVVVLERDPDNQFLEEVRRDGSPLLIGDARREALLGDANIAKARSIVLATTDDLANLEIALDARRINPRIRVVLRMFDQNMADKIRDGFNIHIAMSQSAISAPSFAMSAIQPSIVNSFVVGDRLIVVQRWRVRETGPLCGRTIQSVLDEFGFSVIQHARGAGRPTLFPAGALTLAAGDQLVVQGPYEALHAIEQKAIAVT